MSKLSIKVISKINVLLKEVKIKKQKLLALKNQLEAFKKLGLTFNSNIHPGGKSLVAHDKLISFIINIKLSRSNTLVHVTDFSGNLFYSFSAGNVKYKGKAKRRHKRILKDLFKVLRLRLKFLKRHPIALHLRGLLSLKNWIIRTLKKAFFIRSVSLFNPRPYNGCRKKKRRRKKFRTSSRKNRGFRILRRNG